MIIQSLTRYYDQLLESPDSGIARFGWREDTVHYLLELSLEGELLSIVPCGDGVHGRKIILPEKRRSSSDITANFLSDDALYLLGLNADGLPDQGLKRFGVARQFHTEMLQDLKSDAALAIVRYFNHWNPLEVDLGSRFDSSALKRKPRFAFCVSSGSSWIEPWSIEEIRRRWETYLADNDDSPVMVSLATGKRGHVALKHPAIKGLGGGKAKLISFNQRAFESYGRTKQQGLNAPVDKTSAYAYSAAMDYLNSDSGHHGRIGETSVLFWSFGSVHDQVNCSVFSLALGLSSIRDNVSQDANTKAVVDALSGGKPLDVSGVSFEDEFFLLGLEASSEGRAAVRFFLHDSFGEMMRHVADHYRISDVAHAPNEFPYVSPYWLLKSLENPNAKKPVVSSQLSAPLMQAILRGGRYPESMYENVLLRVRALRTVKREHAAIIRSYLIRNAKKSEREVTVNMNADSKDVAYTLGRAFYVLEHIQEEANGSSTIADRYLSAACSTPATTFPVLLKLSVAHLSKLSREKPGLSVHFEKQLGDLMVRQGSGFPKRLSLVDQGSFLLGYYQQKQARYEKKTNQDNQD